MSDGHTGRVTADATILEAPVEGAATRPVPCPPKAPCRNARGDGAADVPGRSFSERLPQSAPPPSSAPIDPVTAAELASHRGAMLRFARQRIRDDDLAEDAVQEALVAAIANRASFQRQSAVRTWLIGILHHKIQDTFRREGRYVPIDEGDGSIGAGALERFATAQRGPQDDPAERVATARLGEAVLDAIEALSPPLREVFVLQVLDGLSTAEVCRQLGITEANCWVRLHRARRRLAARMRDHLV